MLMYILRRILLMIPTLMGISIITLAMIHLAPGDPVALQLEGAMGKGTISKEEIAALRRTFYLDLPVLFNATPRDLTVANAELMDMLTSSDENRRGRGVRLLATRGGVTWEVVMPALTNADAGARASMLEGLGLMSERMGLKAELEQAAEPVAFWQAQLNQRPEADSKTVQATTTAFLAGDSQAQQRLERWDSVAMPGLIERLLKTSPQSEEALKLTGLLSRIAGTEMSIQPEDKEADRIRIVDDWRRWWGPRRADFVRFEGLTGLTAKFTETQYAKWLKRLVTLDFDRSSRDNRPIREKLGERLQVTVLLATLSLLVAYLIAIPLGMYSAIRQYSTTDRVITVMLFVLYSLPSFWVAMLLQQYLCGADAGRGGLSLFPLVGLTSPEFDTLSPLGKLMDLVWHLILPVGVLTYASFASLSRFQRVGMLDIIRQDFIRTARAKGLPERVVVLKHALRNSVLPIVTLLGMHLPSLVGGAVIVEYIFQINGMGLETLEAIRTRDMNWIMASVTLTAVMTMAGLLLSDILYALVDPRIRVGQG